MDLSGKAAKAAIAALVLVAIGVVYLVWTYSAPPEAKPLPGQSVLAPMGVGPDPAAEFAKRHNRPAAAGRR